LGDPGEVIRQRLQAARLPVVEVGAMARHPIDMNVGVSNFDAGYQLTRHLIERGHRNIGFLCARQEQWMLQQRMQGWQKALLDNYLSPDAIINTSERPSFSTGAAMLGEFAALARTGCADLRQRRAGGRGAVRMPAPPSERAGKLAIAGFDDLDVARACYPALTSVRIPYHQMGQEAAELILRQLAGEEVAGMSLP
jgi:DNA-binding LacI/PurR family transcriptional regulator